MGGFAGESPHIAVRDLKIFPFLLMPSNYVIDNVFQESRVPACSFIKNLITNSTLIWSIEYPRERVNF
jgi:hypothetical protein